MDENENKEFKHVKETLGTLLLLLNCPNCSEEERAILLFWIDALERKLIDMRKSDFDK